MKTYGGWQRPPSPMPPISLRHISRTSIPRRNPFFIVCKKNPTGRSDPRASLGDRQIQWSRHPLAHGFHDRVSLLARCNMAQESSVAIQMIQINLYRRCTTVARSRALGVDMLVLDSTPDIDHPFSSSIDTLMPVCTTLVPIQVRQHGVAAVILNPVMELNDGFPFPPLRSNGSHNEGLGSVPPGGGLSSQLSWFGSRVQT